MSDPIIDELVRANPVAPGSLGELDGDHARQLLERITAPRHSRRVTRRVAIAVLVAIGIMAPLAFAAQHAKLIDLGFGDPPPKHVKQLLDHMLPPAYGPKEGPPDSWNRMNIVKGSERLVATTVLPGGGVGRMYAVDLKNGGVCWSTFGKPFGGGGCGKVGEARRHHTALLAVWGSCCGGSKGNRFAIGATYAGRAVAPSARSILVHYRDGQTDSLRLERGWFMYAVPEAHEVRGHEPVSFDVLDAAGRAVGTVKDPFGLIRRVTRPAERPTHPRLLARVPLNWHGGVIELSTAKGDQGDGCVRVLNTIDLIQTRNWRCDPLVGRSAGGFRDGHAVAGPPVELERGQFTGDDKATGYVYLRGWAGAPVVRLELRFQDSTVQQLTLHDGYFVYVVPETHWALGSRPSYAIGRDAAGRIVYRRFLYPKARCAYPGRDPRCKGLIFHNG